MPFSRRLGACMTSALLTALALPAAADQPYGALFLSTLPTSASVWIDGTYVGRTPVLIDPLARGHHSVTLTKTGWTAQEVDVEIATGVTNMATFRMRTDPKGSPKARTQGSVAFRGLAAGSRIQIDGNRISNDPGSSIPLAAGTHLAVVTSGSGKISRTFTVYPDMTTQVLLGEVAADRPSAIVAPAEEFLPDDAYHVDGTRVVIHYGGHEVVARLGQLSMRFDAVSVSYDAAPTRINGRLYLPLALLTRLTEPKTK